MTRRHQFSVVLTSVIFWNKKYFCVTPPSQEIPQAPPCHTVLFVPQTEKKYLGSPIADRISQSLQFIVQPEISQFFHGQTFCVRSHHLPAIPKIPLLAALAFTQFLQRKKHTDVAFADLITQRYLLLLDLTWGRTTLWKNFFRQIQSLPRYSIGSAFLPQSFLLSKQTKLDQIFNRWSDNQRLQFTVEPEYRNLFVEKHFARDLNFF